MAATWGPINTCTKLSIGLLTCTRFSSNHFVQILYLFVHPPFLRIFTYSNQFVQLKLKLFYFVRIIRNSTMYDKSIYLASIWCIHLVGWNGVFIWLVGMVYSSDWLEWCIHLVCWNGVFIWLVGMVYPSDWLEWCVHLIGWDMSIWKHVHLSGWNVSVIFCRI